jgi:hypothetical protein
VKVSTDSAGPVTDDAYGAISRSTTHAAVTRPEESGKDRYPAFPGSSAPNDHEPAMAEAGMQRLVRRVAGRTIGAALVTWAIMFLWTVIAGPAFDSALSSDPLGVWAAVVLCSAVALAFVARLVADSGQSSDEPPYRL